MVSLGSRTFIVFGLQAAQVASRTAHTKPKPKRRAPIICRVLIAIKSDFPLWNLPGRSKVTRAHSTSNRLCIWWPPVNLFHRMVQDILERKSRKEVSQCACQAMIDMDLRPLLPKTKAPTLVIGALRLLHRLRSSLKVNHSRKILSQIGPRNWEGTTFNASGTEARGHGRHRYHGCLKASDVTNSTTAAARLTAPFGPEQQPMALSPYEAP
jgi:hypothetical protein